MYIGRLGSHSLIRRGSYVLRKIRFMFTVYKGFTVLWAAVAFLVNISNFFYICNILRFICKSKDSEQE